MSNPANSSMRCVKHMFSCLVPILFDCADSFTCAYARSICVYDQTESEAFVRSDGDRSTCAPSRDVHSCSMQAFGKRTFVEQQNGTILLATICRAKQAIHRTTFRLTELLLF